jgi:hypothetical protein
MRRLVVLFLIMGLLGVPASKPAHACGSAKRAGWASTYQIVNTPNLMKLKGVLTLIHDYGSRALARSGKENFYYLGVITEKNGSKWKIHYPSTTYFVRRNCGQGAFSDPISDIKGTFWVSRDEKFDHNLLLTWKGKAPKK